MHRVRDATRAIQAGALAGISSHVSHGAFGLSSIHLAWHSRSGAGRRCDCGESIFGAVGGATIPEVMRHEPEVMRSETKDGQFHPSARSSEWRSLDSDRRDRATKAPVGGVA